MKDSRKLLATIAKGYLNEQQIEVKVPKPNKNFLYHGSNIKNLKDIQRYGLIPDFGDVVKGTEAYNYYMDDDYYNSEDKVEGVIFFSDNPDTWSYSHFGSKPNINEAILVIVKKNETIFRKVGDYVYDMLGKKVNSIKYNRYDYLSAENIPPFIENGDYFSFDEQEPFDILYGERLLKFLKQFS
jgi:hypothetical protein